MTRPRAHPSDSDDLTFTIGREEIDVSHRWETVSIVNDVLVGLWFLVGSFMFLSEELQTVGTWFFIVGSAELLIRPLIRLGRNLHVRRVRGGSRPRVGAEDF